MTDEESSTLVSRNDDYFNFDGLQVGLGLEGTVTKRLSVSLEGFYQRQFGTTVTLLAERWGLKTGLIYRF